jgi:hypothetical protein
MIEHFMVELLCGLTIVDVEANIDSVLDKAIDEWENGPAIADANLATPNPVRNVLLERKMDDIPTVDDIILSTLPPSTSGSPCVDMDDSKVFNGLPSSPQPTFVEQIPNSQIFPQTQVSNVSVATENSAFEFPAPQASPITDFSSNANLLGTRVFVPSASALNIDMPCMTAPVFENKQSHASEWDFNYQTPPTEVVENQLPEGPKLMSDSAPTPISNESTGPYMGSEARTEYESYQYQQGDREGAPSPVPPEYRSFNYGIDLGDDDIMQWCNLGMDMFEDMQRM